MNKIRVKRGQVWSEMHRFLWYFSVFGCFILVFFWYSSITERFGSKRVCMHVLTKAWGFCLVQSPLGMFFRKFMFISYGMLLDARYWICTQWLWIQCIRWINIYKFYMLVWLTNSFSIANALQYFRMSFLGTSHLLFRFVSTLLTPSSSSALLRYDVLFHTEFSRNAISHENKLE